MRFRRYSLHLIQHWLKYAIFLTGLSLFFWLSFQLDNELDARIVLIVAQWRSPSLNGPAVDITALGSFTLLLLFTLFLLILFALKKQWMNFMQLFIAQVGSGLLSRLSKSLIERPRPDMVEKLVDVSHFSYPSGHTLAATTFYVTISLILCEYFHSHKSRMIIFFMALIMMSLVGFSRIYLGVHYPSDVLGGMSLGAAWALLIPALLAFGAPPRSSTHADEHRLHAHN